MIVLHIQHLHDRTLHALRQTLQLVMTGQDLPQTTTAQQPDGGDYSEVRVAVQLLTSNTHTDENLDTLNFFLLGISPLFWLPS